MNSAALSPTGLGHASWQALGTTAVLRVTDPCELASAQSLVERELDLIDRACSRFRPDSELSRLNTQGGRQMQVSGLLLEAIELALRAAELTGGDVDPTVGRALELAGYDRDWQLLCPPRTSSSPAGDSPCEYRLTARVQCGWRSVTIDPSSSSVQVPNGIRLDLGATAKAWAADRAAEAAWAGSGCGVLVSLGGDIGTCGDAPPGGWQIHVTDDHRSPPEAPGQTICIASGGLATSSTAVRRWHHQGEDMHHIIDPCTGRPVRSVWRTVSVAGASCAEANIAATAAIVRADPVATWLSGLGLPARLVDHEGTVLTVGDWPREKP
jgi:thiamine biosynthesis lipoprotein